MRVDDHDLGLEGARVAGNLLDLAAADQRRGRGMRQRHDLRRDDLQSDCSGQTNGLGETGIGIAIGARAGGTRFRLDVDDDGRARPIKRVLVFLQTASDAAGASSCSWIGPSGMTVEIACL